MPLFLVLCLLWCGSELAAQRVAEKNVTIRPSTLPLESLFRQVGEQTGLNFVYSSSDRAITRNVTVNPSTTPVGQLFSLVGAQAHLKFTMMATT